MKNSTLRWIYVSLLFNLSFFPLAYGADYKSVSEIIGHYKTQIVNLDNLDAEDRDYFKKSEPGRSPGIVKADFNGDGKIDLALLTRSELLFFLCADSCKLIKSIDYGGFFGIQYIVPITKGQVVEAFDGADIPPVPSVKLKNTAVHLIFSGKASMAYYWDSAIYDFSKIVTND